MIFRNSSFLHVLSRNKFMQIFNYNLFIFLLTCKVQILIPRVERYDRHKPAVSFRKVKRRLRNQVLAFNFNVMVDIRESDSTFATTTTAIRCGGCFGEFGIGSQSDCVRCLEIGNTND